MLAVVRRPAPSWLRRMIILSNIFLWQCCAQANDFRVRQAYAGIRRARNNGTLIQLAAHYNEIVADAGEWLRYAHTNIAAGKSELWNIQ